MRAERRPARVATPATALGAVLLLVASFFVSGGSTGAGWTLYPPQAILEGTPGSEGGILLMLAEYGTLSLAEVLGPSIELADGYPIDAETADNIERWKDKLKEWPYSKQVMLPHLGEAAFVGVGQQAQLLGLGQLGDVAANLGTQLLTLKFSREDETEADLVGLELAARSAYQPRASVTLWQKMAANSGGSNASFLSTHPSGPERIRQLEANLPKVQGLYEQARKG